MNKNLLIIFVLAIVVSAGVLAVTFMGDDERAKPETSGDDGQRIVCLTPAVTETVFAIGAGADVVGISDRTSYPAKALELPMVGTSLGPNSEAIAKLEPTLILSNNGNGTKKNDIKGLGNTEFLDWLTIQEVATSTRKIGELTGHKAKAEKLAKQYEAIIATPDALNAPTVLVVFGGQPGKLGQILFIRRNSLHGEMLRAAGMKNAVAEDIVGVPNLSIERVLELQPDAILILSDDGNMTSATRSALLADWEALETLDAVKYKRIKVVAIDGLLLPGPRVIQNVPKLRQAIKEVMKD